MKKAIITLAVLCGIGLLAACKSGTASDIATTAEITWTTIEDKLANEIPLDENDCLFILTDTTLDDQFLMRLSQIQQVVHRRTKGLHQRRR